MNVENIDVAMAKRKIHSTNRFFKISDLIAAIGSDYADFHDRLVALTGFLRQAVVSWSER